MAADSALAVPRLSLLLLAGLTLLLLAQQGSALHCWVCSSDADHSCGDPFNNTRQYLVTDCDRDRSHTTYLKSPAVCRKYKHKTGVDSSEEIVVRSCAWGSAEDAEGPCSPSALHFVQHLESCSICTTDECNAAGGLQAGLVSALLLALLIARLI